MLRLAFLLLSTVVAGCAAESEDTGAEGSNLELGGALLSTVKPGIYSDGTFSIHVVNGNLYQTITWESAASGPQGALQQQGALQAEMGADTADIRGGKAIVESSECAMELTPEGTGVRARRAVCDGKRALDILLRPVSYASLERTLTTATARIVIERVDAKGADVAFLPNGANEPERHHASWSPFSLELRGDDCNWGFAWFVTKEPSLQTQDVSNDVACAAIARVSREAGEMRFDAQGRRR